MKYNPYTRRRRLNSSLQPNYDEIVRRTVVDIVTTRFRFSLADVEKFECVLYETDTNSYICWKVKIGHLLGVGSNSLKLYYTDEKSILEACDVVADQINAFIQDKLKNVIESEVGMSLARVSYSDLEISDIYRYDNEAYACEVSVTSEGEIYSEMFVFELYRESIEHECNWFAHEVLG